MTTTQITNNNYNVESTAPYTNCGVYNKRSRCWDTFFFAKVTDMKECSATEARECLAFGLRQKIVH